VHLPFDYKDNGDARQADQKQTTAPVMVESRHYPENTDRHRPDKKVKYPRTKVNGILRSKTINKELGTGIDQVMHVTTDDGSSYKKIGPMIGLTAHKVNAANLDKVPPWIHNAISNAKRSLLDVHHRIDDDFPQIYVNGFCYKFNRRIARVRHRWNEL